MKTNAPVYVILGIAVTMVLVGTSSSLVSAQIPSPCTATLSYPVMSAVYPYSNVPIVVPISATCATSYSSQLYATGNAYDATANTGLGSVSTILTSVNGGTYFNGQLGFDLPPTAQGDSVQISVSIYDSPYGNLLTATSETVEVGTAIQQVATTTVTEVEYPYAAPSPTPYTSQPYQPSPLAQLQLRQVAQTKYHSQVLARSINNTNLYDYLIIIGILATLIIATTGLVLVARRRRTWPQPQYALPQ